MYYNQFMKTYHFLFVLIFSFLAALPSFGQRPTDQARPERKFTGQVIDGAAKTPMIGANVLIKTVTDSLLRGTVTGADGRFELPSRQAALLLRFGDYSMNMRLVLQRQGYVAWRTNFPMAALGTNQPGPEPRIETGAIRMQRR